MSIYKPFIVDSQNRSRGDDGSFEIDISKNYFSKPPNSIKLIDTVFQIDSVLINETNNKMRIEKLDSNYNVISYLDITFPNSTEMSGSGFYHEINNQINATGINFLGTDVEFNVVEYDKNIRVINNVEYIDSIPIDSYNVTKKIIEKFENKYYSIFIGNNNVFPITDNIKDLNIAINFDIDNSIGDLFGFGKVRLMPNRDLYSYVPNYTSPPPLGYYEPLWAIFKYFYKSSNKITEFRNFNMINLSPNYNTIVISDGLSTSTINEYTITIPFIDLHGLDNNAFINLFVPMMFNNGSFNTKFQNLYGAGTNTFSGEFKRLHFQLTFNSLTDKLIDLNLSIQNRINFINFSNFYILNNNNSTYKFYNKQTQVLEFDYYTNFTNNFHTVTTLNNAFAMKQSGTSESSWQTFNIDYNGTELKADVDPQIILPYTPPEYTSSNGIAFVRTVFDTNTVDTGQVFRFLVSGTNEIYSATDNEILSLNGIQINVNDMVLFNFGSGNDNIYNGIYVCILRHDTSPSHRWMMRRIVNYGSQNNVRDIAHLGDFCYDTTNNEFYFLNYTNSPNSPILNPGFDRQTWIKKTFVNFNYLYHSCGFYTSSDGLSTITNSFNWKMKQPSITSYIGSGPGKRINIINNGVNLTINGAIPIGNNIILVNNDDVNYSIHNGIYICVINTITQFTADRIDNWDSSNIYNNSSNVSDIITGNIIFINVSPGLKLFSLTNKSSTFKRYFNTESLLTAMETAVNQNHNIISFPTMDVAPNNIINIKETGKGKYIIKCNSANAGNSIKPFIFNFDNTLGGIFYDYLGFDKKIHENKSIYESDFEVDYIKDFNFTTDLYDIKLILPENRRTIELPAHNTSFKTTKLLINYINNTIASIANDVMTIDATKSNIRVNYDYNTKSYTIFNSTGQTFDISFLENNGVISPSNVVILSRLDEILGFKNAILTGKNSYTGTTVDSIEETSKPRTLYICSDLVDSIDSGAIIPTGGSLPVKNVLFAIPIVNATNNINNSQFESAVSQEFYINSSLFSQKIKENRYTNDIVTIKFWLAMPGGVGFVKRPWYMRTLLSFKNVV